MLSTVRGSTDFLVNTRQSKALEKGQTRERASAAESCDRHNDIAHKCQGNTEGNATI